MITICSDGDGNISQQAQWSGYKKNFGVAEILKDLEVFVISIKKQSLPNENFVGEEAGDKQIKMKKLTMQIDSMLDKINKLKEGK